MALPGSFLRSETQLTLQHDDNMTIRYYIVLPRIYIYILFKPLSSARYSHKEHRRTVHKLCHVRKPLAQHDVRRSAVHRACAICGKVYMIG